VNYEDVIKGKGITLPSNDPGTLDKTVLRSLIGILANPYDIYGFYSDPNNVPQWWPDCVPFQSTNNPGKGKKKLSVSELRTILGSFLKSYPSLLSIANVTESSKLVVEEATTLGDVSLEPKDIACTVERCNSSLCLADLEVPVEHFNLTVECPKCLCKYHSICIGSLGQGYVCCGSHPGDQRSVLTHLSIAGVLTNDPRKTQGLFVSDVKTLMAGRGISNGIVDFYIQQSVIKGCRVGTIVLSSLTCQAVAASGKSMQILQTKLKNLYTAQGLACIRNSDVLLVPWRLSSAWHWVLVVILPQSSATFIIDSLTTTSLTRGVVSQIHLLKSTLGIEVCGFCCTCDD
jgi:hypothetical protein